MICTCSLGRGSCAYACLVGEQSEQQWRVECGREGGGESVMHTCICVSGGIGTGRGVGAILAEDFAGQISVVTICCVPIMEGPIVACVVVLMAFAVGVCLYILCRRKRTEGGGSAAIGSGRGGSVPEEIGRTEENACHHELDGTDRWN